MAESGIYEIVNLVNGKRYVGSSVDLKKRWAGHRYNLRRGKHHCRHLQSSWAKYGEDQFSFRVLEFCERHILRIREQEAIDQLRPEYNSSPTAGSLLGFKMPESAGRKHSERQRGRKLSASHADAIRKAALGRKRPDMVGNQWGRRKQTEAERLVNSLSKRGRPKSPLAKANIAAASVRPEVRAARSKFMKEVWARRKSASL